MTRLSGIIGIILAGITFVALIGVLLGGLLLHRSFSIPSASMSPALIPGDRILVAKYTYGVRWRDLIVPLPLTGRIWTTLPTRGDVIVFENPNDRNRTYIKRLIGLPGETVQMKEGVVYIDGTPAKITAHGEVSESVEVSRSQVCLTRKAKHGMRACIKNALLETLPSGAEHVILNADRNRTGSDNTRVYKVPDGHYFFLGDNRDNSGDSRTGKMGFIPFHALIGRAEIVTSSSAGHPLNISGWRSDRFMKIVR